MCHDCYMECEKLAQHIEETEGKSLKVLQSWWGPVLAAVLAPFLRIHFIFWDSRQFNCIGWSLSMLIVNVWENSLKNNKNKNNMTFLKNFSLNIFSNNLIIIFPSVNPSFSRMQPSFGSRSSLATSQARGESSDIDFSWIREEENKLRNERGKCQTKHSRSNQYPSFLQRTQNDFPNAISVWILRN